jgi:hypothetical protein
VRAGAGDSGEVCGGRRMARDAVARAEEGSKEGIEPRLGRGRRVEGGEAGGGAAAAAEQRPGAKPCWRQEKQSRPARARGRRREKRGPGGPIWKSQKLQGPLDKLKFPTDVEV